MVLGSSEALIHDGPEPFQAEYSIRQRTVQLTVNPVDWDNHEAGKVLVLGENFDGAAAGSGRLYLRIMPSP